MTTSLTNQINLQYSLSDYKRKLDYFIHNLKKIKSDYNVEKEKYNKFNELKQQQKNHQQKLINEYNQKRDEYLQKKKDYQEKYTKMIANKKTTLTPEEIKILKIITGKQSEENPNFTNNNIRSFLLKTKHKLSNDTYYNLRYLEQSNPINPNNISKLTKELENINANSQLLANKGIYKNKIYTFTNNLNTNKRVLQRNLNAISKTVRPMLPEKKQSKISYHRREYVNSETNKNKLKNIENIVINENTTKNNTPKIIIKKGNEERIITKNNIKNKRLDIKIYTNGRKLIHFEKNRVKK